MRFFKCLAFGLAVLGQVGCSHSSERKSPTDSALPPSPETTSVRFTPPVSKQDEEANARVDYTITNEPSTQEEAQPAPAPPQVGPINSRLLIYHAQVALKTNAMPRAMARLDSLVQRSSGYLSAATETRADGEWRQETTIRVPPAHFQALLSGLAGLGTVEKKELSTSDVTAEHADVAARLHTKRAMERQYTNLLGKAQKIKDILDIEEKLGAVREEIEATESRLKTLASEVAYSTITLTLHQPLPQAVPDAPVVSLGSRVVEAFYGGWQLLTSLLVGTLALWPLLLLSAGGYWLWQRRRTRLRPASPRTSS